MNSFPNIAQIKFDKKFLENSAVTLVRFAQKNISQLLTYSFIQMQT